MAGVAKIFRCINRNIMHVIFVDIDKMTLLHEIKFRFAKTFNER